MQISVSRLDQNLDLADHNKLPLEKGVPALAELDTDGKLLHSQKAGEFEAMRKMQSGTVTEFLNQWQPASVK